MKIKKKMNLQQVVLLFGFFALSQCLKIAVVEYQPLRLSNASQETVQVLLNMLAYTKEVAHLESETKLDLIVFPEATLLDDRVNAFEAQVGKGCVYQTGDPLDAIACLAQSYHTYIVLNLVEKIECEIANSSNCLNYGYNFYNTDVVFDRNGTLIRKYRKFNLFGEYSLDKPQTADLVTFDTDFGRFGIFTCFDILFKSPAQDLVQLEKIDAAIFPTMWFSELPFLTALQTQQMWSQENDVILIASGANNPSVGSGGSGVYLGKEGLAIGGIVAEGGTQGYIYDNAKLAQTEEEIDSLAQKMDRFFLKRDRSLDDYTAFVLDSSRREIAETLCYKDSLCCEFSLKLSERNTTRKAYTYQLVAYSGVRSFDDVYYGGIEICGIIACLNASLSSCGLRFANYEEIDWPISFEEISIVGNFEKSDNKTQFPNSLLSSIRPIHANQTVWEREEIEDNGKIVIQRRLSIREKQDRLMTFAIFGRDFGWDHAPDERQEIDNGRNSGSGLVLNFVLFVLVLLFILCR